MSGLKPCTRAGFWTRREFLFSTLAGLGLGTAGAFLLQRPGWRWLLSGYQSVPGAAAAAFIGRADSYEADLRDLILRGLRELGLGAEAIRRKRILLKPNLVEPSRSAPHINTHPLVIRAAVEAFLTLGAAEVLVGEGPGHRRDICQVLEESGLEEVLREDQIPYLDLNNQPCQPHRNRLGFSRLPVFMLPEILQQVDWLVSVAKMKTHHWAGATLSMKNLYGLLPGIYYGWPKNLLHWAGIPETIADLNALVRPQLAIVDGIVGMEGDGPIMGTPKRAGVLVMGCNLPAVDATCARIMGLNPYRIRYLTLVDGYLGPLAETRISQRGEEIKAVTTPFALVDDIPAHQGLRL